MIAEANMSLQEQERTLQEQNHNLKRDLDLLINDNEDKEIEIKRQALELKLSQHKVMSFMVSAEQAIDDANQGLL